MPNACVHADAHAISNICVYVSHHYLLLITFLVVLIIYHLLLILFCVVAHYLLVNNYSANAYAYHPVYVYANASALCICPCLCHAHVSFYRRLCQCLCCSFKWCVLPSVGVCLMLYVRNTSLPPEWFFMHSTVA